VVVRAVCRRDLTISAILLFPGVFRAIPMYSSRCGETLSFDILLEARTLRPSQKTPIAGIASE
jgi:hypothetical protein